MVIIRYMHAKVVSYDGFIVVYFSSLAIDATQYWRSIQKQKSHAVWHGFSRQSSGDTYLDHGCVQLAGPTV